MRGISRFLVFSGVAACVFALASQTVLAASYSVTIMSTQFVPSTLSVLAGDSITFINNTLATQSAKTSVASGFNTGDIGAGKSKTVTVSSPGTFSYTSTYTPSLTGTVVVTSTSSTTSSTSATTTSTSTTQTQSLPVSGTTENLIALSLFGAAFFLYGLYRWIDPNSGSTVVALPMVSSRNETLDRENLES